MIFSVEEILSDEVVVSAVSHEGKRMKPAKKWLATKGTGGILL